MAETTPYTDTKIDRVFHQRKYSGALIDVAGVIIDSEKMYYEANKKLFGEYGIVITPQDYIKYWLDVERKGLAGVIKDNKLNLDIELVKKEKQAIQNKLLHMIEPMPHAHKFLEYLREHKVPVAAITSSYRESAEESLKKCKLIEYITVIVTRDDVKNEKPHPEPYKKGAQMLHLAPESCICVEDTPAGIISAKDAGVGLVIGCPNEWTKRLSFEGKAKPHVMVNSLEEIIKLDLF
ncbi:MAG: HAD family phosphatase [Candidatus Woesearchaeota archaeon]|nr:HAD family phosphatase [Candidatus Woesearchaeota archaeon]